jgi:hypothetical protein
MGEKKHEAQEVEKFYATATFSKLPICRLDLQVKPVFAGTGAVFEENGLRFRNAGIFLTNL